MKKIAVALSIIGLAISPTVAQTHRQWETVNRPLPPMQYAQPSHVGGTGEYNGRFEERGVELQDEKNEEGQKEVTDFSTRHTS